MVLVDVFWGGEEATADVELGIGGGGGGCYISVAKTHTLP